MANEQTRDEFLAKVTVLNEQTREEHLAELNENVAILKKGVDAWNEWRAKNANIRHRRCRRRPAPSD